MGSLPEKHKMEHLMNIRLRQKIHRMLLLTLLVSTPVRAMLTVSVDADVRGDAVINGERHAEIHAAGLLLRKSIADPSGDRFILTLLAEAYDFLRQGVLHETSFRIKGPMGRWNITTGRFNLPYGLLGSFSTTRLLMSTWYDAQFGFDVDNGVLVSGIAGDVDYGVSVTQGRGPHHRFILDNSSLVTGRVGYTSGDAGDLVLGASALIGDLAGEHSSMMKHRIAGVGADGTFTHGSLVARTSVDGGRKDDRWYLLTYVFTQYGINRFVDVDIGGKAEKTEAAATGGMLYLGSTLRSRYLTIRGGYTYEVGKVNEHRVSFQLYRMFSTLF